MRNTAGFRLSACTCTAITAPQRGTRHEPAPAPPLSQQHPAQRPPPAISTPVTRPRCTATSSTRAPKRTSHPSAINWSLPRRVKRRQAQSAGECSAHQGDCQSQAAELQAAKPGLPFTPDRLSPAPEGSQNADQSVGAQVRLARHEHRLRRCRGRRGALGRTPAGMLVALLHAVLAAGCPPPRSSHAPQRQRTSGAPKRYSVSSTRRTGSLLRPMRVVSLPSLQVPAPPSP